MNKAIVGLLALLAWRQVLAIALVGLLLIALLPQALHTVPPVMVVALAAAVLVNPYLRRRRFGSH